MINIRIDKAAKCADEYSLFISFPYDSKIVDVMRNLPIRYWNPDSKEWEVAIKFFDVLKNELKDYQINVSNSNDDLFKSIFSKKQCNYIPKDYKFKITPFKHQIEGIEYGLNYDRFLLGDEQRFR